MVWCYFLGDGVTTDDVETKPGSSDNSHTCGGSAEFVDLYSQTLPSFHVEISSNFTPPHVVTLI